MQVVDVQHGRVQQAGLTALGLFAFLAVLLFSRFPSVLPAYPAVIVAFSLWCVLPGWFLQRALFASKSTGLVERVAVAFLMSMAVAAVPGLIGLRLHWSIEGFGLAYAAIAALACGGSLLISSAAAEVKDAGDVDPETPRSAGSYSAPVLLALIAIPLLAILTAPWWEDGRVARDADDLVYSAYVLEYSVDGLDASEPFADTKRGAFGRMQFNVWVILQGLVAQSAGVEAVSLLLVYLPPIMTLLVVASMFALAKGLFRNEQIALLACLLLVIYGGLDLSPHEGFGRNIFLRVGEDKMVASYVLLPLGLLLSTRYLERGGWRYYAAALLAIVALFVTHPMALMFLGVVIAFLTLLRLASERSRSAVAQSGLLLVPWAVAAAGLYLSAKLGAGRVVLIDDPFRRAFHVTDILGDQIVANFHLVLHPFVLVSIVLAPALWLFSRRNLGLQVLLASVMASMAMMFIPPIATAIADVVNEETVWRAHWLIPAPLIIAYGLHLLIAKVPSGRSLIPGITRPAMAALAGVLALSVGAFLVQEHYVLADDDTSSYTSRFYRTSPTTLLPWLSRSIVVGGIERAFSSEWRPPATEAALLEFLKDNAPPGSTVLMPPTLSDRFFPSLLQDVKSLNSAGGSGFQLREAFVYAFYNGRLAEIAPGRDLETMLDDFSVDYVVVAPRSEFDDDARSFADFDADDFVVELGEPELITAQSPLGVEYRAWAFDARDEERIGGGEFTVPADMDPSRATLEFVFETAPVTPVAEDTSARLVVTYFPVGGGETTSVVMDVRVKEGTQQGERIITRRPVGGTVEAGGSYRFIVSRLPNDPEDELAEDVLFAGLRVKYWPVTFVPVGDTGFSIYSR